mmetsp:Transcript_42824/g.128549  ORF Transcript_42824/g.128549 Transcript_42824/m.128549 type:complete len:548 (-) Transcript_42824:301-1944(-)
MDEDLSMSQECYPLSQIATLQPQLQASSLGKGKHFNCSVHGFMRFDATCISVIDTPQFQRLRDLKQLGCAHYVFPTATHTRFDHSLGVCHLANHFAQHIYSMQGKELGMDKADILCVALAGLCHDLGHGPFSHVFDHELLRAKGITDWKHEDMSCRILDVIMEGLPEQLALGECDVARVKAMIDPEGQKASCSTASGSRYLYDIVSNERNSVDVDKFDYLARDSYHCGVKITFDHKRPMAYSKVLGDEVCFKQSEYQALHELFHSRELMTRQVYTHRKAKSVEFMMVDALSAADELLNLKDFLYDPARFICLDDSLIKTIENYQALHPRHSLDDRETKALAKAQAIVARIRRRELYKFVNELKVPPEGLKSVEQAKVFTPENIAACYRGCGVRLRPEDIIVSTNKINFAMKDKNPLDNVHFFDDFDDTLPRKISNRDALHMQPTVFQEHSLRVYSRNRDLEVMAALHEAFSAWKDKYLGRLSLNFATPAKARRPGGSVPSSTAASQEMPPPMALHDPQAALQDPQGQSKRKRSLMPDLDMVDLPAGM